MFGRSLSLKISDRFDAIISLYHVNHMIVIAKLI